MPQVAMGLGVILIVLGVGGYFGTGQASLTALIPAAFGLLFLVLGALARRPHLRKHVMHAAAGLALLGVIGAFSGLIAVVRLLGGADLERPVASYAQTAMVLLCLVFLVLCVRSFIQARRQGDNA